MKREILVSIVILLASTVAMGQITIDGDMLDWDGIPKADVGNAAEELGDMATGPEFDWQDVYITSDTTNLYVRVTIDPSATFTEGYDNYDNPPVYELHLSTAIEDTTGLDWGWWNIKSNYNISLNPFVDPSGPWESSTILHYIGNHAASVWPDSWDSVGVATGAVNGDDNEVEVAIPWEYIDAHADVRPMLYGVGDNIWANEDIWPDDVTAGAEDSYLVNYNPYSGTSVVQVNGTGINSDITIDGDLLDWADFDYVDQGEVAEDLGDMPTGPEFDVQGVKMTSDSNYAYFMFEIDESATFSGAWDNYEGEAVYELHFETNFADTAGLAWGGFWNIAPEYIVGLNEIANPDVSTSEATVTHYSGYYGAAIWPDDYDSVGTAMAMVNGDDNAMEIAVPREKLAAGSDVRPMLYVVGDGIWDNEEYFPNDVTLEDGMAYVLNYNFYSGSSNVQVTGTRGVTNVEDEFDNALADEFTLHQNYPNPFNPSTTINYTVPSESRVTLEVYNVLGEHVKTLVNSVQQPNKYSVVWNSTDSYDNAVSSGVYFYKLVSGNTVQVKKMVLVR